MKNDDIPMGHYDSMGCHGQWSNTLIVFIRIGIAKHPWLLRLAGSEPKTKPGPNQLPALCRLRR